MPWIKFPSPSDDERKELDEQFRGKGRFLVDESVGNAVAEMLRTEGYNAKYVGEVGLTGRSDEEVLAYAWADSRIIVIHDPDFLDDRRFPPHVIPVLFLSVPGLSVVRVDAAFRNSPTS